MDTDLTPTAAPSADDDPLSHLSDIDTGHLARLTEAFLALTPAGREAVLLWLLPQQLPQGTGQKPIDPPPALTESMTELDRELIPRVIGEFTQLSEPAREVALNLAMPQFVEE